MAKAGRQSGNVAALKGATKETTGARAGRTPRVVVVMPDGVKVLAPKSKPDHFTNAQILETIKELRSTGVIKPLPAASDE